MATHGGMRPGAGRPPGGITETRRLLDIAIRRGMADAVRDRVPGIPGGDDELAIVAAAQIVRQMMAAGQGDRVLALAVQVAPAQAPGKAGGEAAGEAGGSALSAALGRMPGGLGDGQAAIGAPVAHQCQHGAADDGSSAGAADGWPADQQSAGRLDGACFVRPAPLVLPGQLALGVDAPGSVEAAGMAGDAGGFVAAGAGAGAGAGESFEAGAAAGGAAAGAGGGAAGRAAGAPPPTPTPPRAAAPAVIHPHGSNFEILNGDAAADGPGDHPSTAQAGDDGLRQDSRQSGRGVLLQRSGAVA